MTSGGLVSVGEAVGPGVVGDTVGAPVGERPPTPPKERDFKKLRLAALGPKALAATPVVSESYRLHAVPAAPLVPHGQAFPIPRAREACLGVPETFLSSRSSSSMSSRAKLP